MIPRPNRKKVLNDAKILNDGLSVTCLVKNISESGASLLLPEHFIQPKNFVLARKGLPERNCEVIWKRARLVGVKFV
jgi:hypothetical protein